MNLKEKAPARCSNTDRGQNQNSQTAKFDKDWCDESIDFTLDFQLSQRVFTGSCDQREARPANQAEALPEIRTVPGNSGSSRSSGGFGPEGMALMRSPLTFYRSLSTIPQLMMDYLLILGVDPLAIGSGANPPLKAARGRCARDGWFDAEEFGSTCYAVSINDGGGVIDVGFWDARSGHTARLLKCGFALGEEQIDNPGTYCFSGHLKIHASPLGWLRSGRDGVFVLDWGMAFDRLRDCPRIAIDARLLPTYRKTMQPAPMPELFVFSDNKETA